MAKSLKRLLNRSEAVVHERLRRACEPNGTKVYPKVRLADVLPIERSGIASEPYSFALKSHLDFIVVKETNDPLFAVEFDGPSHQDEAQRGRDRLKDKLCKDFGLPLLRVRDAHLAEAYRSYDILTWIVEQWFLREAFDAAQESGAIPDDEIFDPSFILGLPGEKPFPMWLSLEAQNAIAKRFKEGRLLHRVPSYIIGLDGQETRRGLIWIRKTEDEFVHVVTGARPQGFPVDLSDLVSQVGIVKLHVRLEEVLAERTRPTSRHELEALVVEYGKLTLLTALGTSSGAP